MRASQLIEYAGKLIFRNDVDQELWISDGTVVGTKLIKGINLDGVTSVANSRIYNQSFNDTPIFLPDGRLLFGVNDGINGREPWVTDGTEEGTILLKDINSGVEDGYSD
jgi:ELWxxDGT repeat protein